jgi:hypothetical protein
MNQNTLVQMLRLRTLAARKGMPFNVERFAVDRPYAKSTLKALLQIDDADLQAACRQMMETLRLRAPATDLTSTLSPGMSDGPPMPGKPEASTARPEDLVESGGA